jgi:hypothetical protein
MFVISVSFVLMRDSWSANSVSFESMSALLVAMSSLLSLICC